jgi:hypothetical protein
MAGERRSKRSAPAEKEFNDYDLIAAQCLSLVPS